MYLYYVKNIDQSVWQNLSVFMPPEYYFCKNVPFKYGPEAQSRSLLFGTKESDSRNLSSEELEDKNILSLFPLVFLFTMCINKYIEEI